MSLTQCCECDRAAVRFWGPVAYCVLHLREASAAEPDAHTCSRCGEQQPPQVLWRRDRPCGTCQDGMRRDTSAYEHRGVAGQDPELDPVEAAVIAAGLFEGFPAQRRVLVANLKSEGVTASEVGILAEWAERSFTRSKRAGGLAKVLADPARRNEVLLDHAHYARTRQRRRPGEADYVSPTAPAEWDEIDLARRVAARVDGDQRPLGDVAAEFGLDPAEAKDLLHAGREMARGERNQPTKPDLLEPKDHADRVEQFRKDMADAKAAGVTLDVIIRRRQR